MTVSNTTTFSDGLQADTTGTSSPLGIVLSGTGTLNISNQHGGAMSNALPLIVSGGLHVNIGLEADGVTTAGTGFTAITGVQLEKGTITTRIANAFASSTNLILGSPTFGGGGTFATEGTTQSMNYLDLQAYSVIDLGLSNTTTGITFAASSSANTSTAVVPGQSTTAENAWATGAILRISDWKSNAQTPFVVTGGLGGTGALLSSTNELSHIHFTGYYTGAQLLSGTNVVPASATRLYLGDASLNQQVDAGDLSAMESALTNLSGYESTHSFDLDDALDVLDVNQDGVINNGDLEALTYDLSHSITPTYKSVPEPSTLALGLLGAVSMVSMALKRRRSVA